MKKILLFLGIIITILVLTGCAKEPEFNFEDGKIVVGLEAAYAPFNWLETIKSDTNVKLDGMNSYVEGYDVQIAKLLAEDLGLELVIKMIDWDGLVPALKSGMIDCIIAGMSPTEKRKKSISFTDEYYRSEHVVIVKNNGKFSDAKDINDFKGAKIIGQKSTLYDTLAEQLASKAGGKYQTPLDNVPAIINSIKTGVSDATIVERPVAISVVNNNPDLKFIRLLTNFEIKEVDEIVSIGVRKGDTILKEKLNQSLAKILQDQREALMDQAAGNAPADDE